MKYRWNNTITIQVIYVSFKRRLINYYVILNGLIDYCSSSHALGFISIMKGRHRSYFNPGGNNLMETDDFFFSVCTTFDILYIKARRLDPHAVQPPGCHTYAVTFVRPLSP